MPVQVPYPKNQSTNWEVRGHFWCSHSPLRYTDERYLVIDPTGDVAAEITGKKEAESLCDKWNRYGGELVTTTWEPPPDDADDSHRGTYRVMVKGMPSLTRSFGGGWHSDASARQYGTELRNFIAEQRKAAECRQNGTP